MWPLIKAEIKYNSDLIYPLLWGVFLFFLIQYYYSYGPDINIDTSAILLLQGGLFLPVVVGIRRSKEKRNRLQVLLPFSIRQIGIARLLIFGFYLALMFVLVSILNFCSARLFPNTVYSFTLHLSTAGMTMIYTVIFYFLIHDLNGYIDRNKPFFKIPVQGIYNFFKLILILVGIAFYFPLIKAIRNFPVVPPPGFFDRYVGTLVYRMVKSTTWAVGLVVFGLLLSVLAVLEFEKCKSYVE
jgi:hypothetical protein